MPIGPDAGQALAIERGSAVVCVPLTAVNEWADSRDRTLTTLRSVLEHTDSSVPLVIAGPAGNVAQTLNELELGPRDRMGELHTLELGVDSDEADAVDTALRASFPGDVVLVRTGIEVAAGWLERLQAAALSDSTVASATPLSLGAGGVNLAEDPGLSALVAREDHSISSSADRIFERSLRLWPRIASIGPCCAYIRREALELVGLLDKSLAVEDALADLAARAIRMGMVHVAADDVFVTSARDTRSVPASTGSAAKSSGQDGRDADAVSQTLACDERGRLSRALGIAHTALRPLSVTIDGRSLTSVVGGTQTYVLELIAALARDGSVELRVLVPHDLSERARRVLAELPDLELLGYEQALKKVVLSDVVHRPQQAFTPDDLKLLRLVGRRVVIGHQDLIAYHNFSYHQDVDRWRAYRRTTRLALAVADQVVFFSEHARRDALAEDLLPAGRAHTVGVGADAVEPQGPEAQPDGAPGERPFLLCMGADYAHKNRPFAIELIEALGELGWQGCLVLAGAHVPFGSSREAEFELLERRPGLRDRVIDLGSVDDQGKRWLYRHARALLYPTIYEGFGLLPLEASRAGLPCLFASQASLAELAGEAATLRPWDARASAAAVLPLLMDGLERDEHLARLRALDIPSWSAVAKELTAIYEQALVDPPSEAAPRAWQDLDRESFIASLDNDIIQLKATAQEYQDAYHSLTARVAHGLPLIDEGGLLSPAQQRGLMRIASRRVARVLALGPLGLLGRVGASSQLLNRGDRANQTGGR